MVSSLLFADPQLNPSNHSLHETSPSDMWPVVWRAAAVAAAAAVSEDGLFADVRSTLLLRTYAPSSYPALCISLSSSAHQTVVYTRRLHQLYCDQMAGCCINLARR